MADDAINSSFSGVLRVDKITALDLANSIVGKWISEQGRWFPLGWYYGYAQWHLVPSIAVYKVLQVLGVMVASGLTWWLVRVLGYSRSAASLVILSVTCIIQLRGYFDSILSFSQLMPLVWSGVVCSLIFFAYWLKRRKVWLLALSVLFFVLARSTYEGIELLFPLYVLTAYLFTRSWKQTAIASITPALFCGFFLVLTQWLRSRASAGEGGPYAASFDPSEIFYTASDQVIAAVPLTYQLFDPQGIFAPAQAPGLMPGVIVGLVALALAAALTLAVGQHAAEGEARSPGASWLVAMGLLVVLLASLPISLSARYQGELIAGLGHVQTFIGYFGVGMVIAGFFFALASRHRRTGAVVSALLLGLLATFTYRANEIVVAHLEPGRWFYDAETNAMKAGLFEQVTPFSTLFSPLQGLSPWQTRGFYQQFSGKTLYLDPVEKYNPVEVRPRRQGCDSNEPGRVWTKTELTGDKGYVYLTCIDYRGAQDTYVYLTGVSRSDVIAVAGLKRPDEPDAYRIWGSPGAKALQPVAGRPGVYRLLAPEPIDPRTFRLLWF